MTSIDPALDYGFQFEPPPIVIAPPLFDCGYEPGIYFGMPDEEYHAIKALSTTGIKKLLVSSMDFWAATRWLNPDYQEDEERTALVWGKAYHARIVEGAEAFHARYAPAFEKSDHPDALDTADDLKEALRSLDLPVSGNKPGLIARLRDADPAIMILEDVRAEHEVQHNGKTFVSHGLIAAVEKAAFLIERDPVASKCFTGGYAEVTIIWIDPETGVPMKARMDYLKLKAIIDLKSFSNPLGKPIDKALYAAMASRKYHIQAAVYTEADTHAMRLAREGAVFGEVSPEWIEKYKAFGEQGEAAREFVFVFQQTGQAPVTRVRRLPHHFVYGGGVEAMKEAQRRFAQCWKTYGSDPWLDLAPLEDFEDELFPLYTTEI